MRLYFTAMTVGFIHAQVWLPDSLCSYTVPWSGFLVDAETRGYIEQLGKAFKFASACVTQWLPGHPFSPLAGDPNQKNCPSGPLPRGGH